MKRLNIFPNGGQEGLLGERLTNESLFFFSFSLYEFSRFEEANSKDQQTTKCWNIFPLTEGQKSLTNEAFFFF